MIRPIGEHKLCTKVNKRSKHTGVVGGGVSGSVDPLGDSCHDRMFLALAIRYSSSVNQAST